VLFQRFACEIGIAELGKFALEVSELSRSLNARDVAVEADGSVLSADGTKATDCSAGG